MTHLINQFLKPSDIWALGILLHVLMFGKRPHKAKTKKELKREIMNGIRIDSNDTFSKLIEQMLEINYKSRIDINGVLNYLADNEYGIPVNV